ncbi:MAG: YbaK/EbsC family protein, partial [Anaerolineae bacterium]
HRFPDSIHSATGVAECVGKPPAMVYKTLVVLRTRPKTKPMLVMVAADRELDLKQVAKAVAEKKVKMAPHRRAEELTGLRVGGISALALLNRGFEVYIDRPARALETVLVSAGRRGLNVELPVNDLVAVTGAKWIDAS